VSGPRFDILFVCTGNVCRSAFAELLTRRLLDRALPPPTAARVAVASAGCAALTGAGVHPLTRAELEVRGVTRSRVAAHVARQVDERMLVAADVVLTAERRHRAHVVEMCPEVLGRTFCLREIHRLLSDVDLGMPGDPVPRLHAAVAAAAGRRGMIPPVPAEEDTVPDPFGRPAQAHRYSAALIDDLLHDLVFELIVPVDQDASG
jgi:protein-tyrosine phosphatase